jgi:hypothetical protein
MSWTNWFGVGVLLVQIIIAITSYFTIHRHRAVYGMKTAVLRMPHGEALDVYSLNTEHIDKDLKEGKYTILQIVERPDKDLEVILGQIKK